MVSGKKGGCEFLILKEMKTNYLEFILLFLFLPFLTLNTSAQVNNAPGINVQLSFSRFLSGVSNGNVEYIARQLNVSIAEAELKASKVFPDPEIAVSYSNNEDKKLQLGQSLETSLRYPVNLGNKRGAGISLARSQYELSGLMLDAYFQSLRANAAKSYFVALRNQKVNSLQQEILMQMDKLARTDSLRLVAGEANALDAMQSSLEARTQLSAVYQSSSEMQNSFIDLLHFQGIKSSDTIQIPSDDFPVSARDFNISDLIQNAEGSRADLLAAIKNNEVSANNLRLVRAGRSFEIDLEPGYSFNTISKNSIAPAPAYNSISAGVSIPLKFSSFNTGAIKAAELAMEQTKTMNREIEIRIISEVRQAYNTFLVQSKKLELFRSGMISEAEKIMNGRIYSYQHGESSFIEVLNAQKTYIELSKNYIDAQLDYTSALIDLEWASGIWDISLP
jgi:cobalt-zinc-cadmium efflux system outer membrane protein